MTLLPCETRAGGSQRTKNGSEPAERVRGSKQKKNSLSHVGKTRPDWFGRTVLKLFLDSSNLDHWRVQSVRTEMTGRTGEAPPPLKFQLQHLGYLEWKKKKHGNSALAEGPDRAPGVRGQARQRRSLRQLTATFLAG